MRIKLADGSLLDTARDLSPAERHILQKILCYKEFATSIHEFRQKTAKAFAAGWNQSGGISQSPMMSQAILQLEQEILKRLSQAPPSPENKGS